MTRKAQKEEEQRYLDEFLQVLPREIRVVDNNRERPDFEVSDVERHRIGLEVVQYHDGRKIVGGIKPRHALEKDWEQLRLKINELRSNDPILKSIHGHASFQSSCFPKRKEFDSFVGELVSCAEAHKSKLPQRITEFVGYPLLQENLKSLRIKKVASVMSWDSDLRAGWLGIDANSLVNLVKRKAEDLDHYSVGQGFDEYWLLIISGCSIAQSMGPNAGEKIRQIAEFDECLMKSKFSYAYLFQYMFNSLYEWPNWRMIKEGHCS